MDSQQARVETAIVGYIHYAVLTGAEIVVLQMRGARSDQHDDLARGVFERRGPLNVRSELIHGMVPEYGTWTDAGESAGWLRVETLRLQV